MTKEWTPPQGFQEVDSQLEGISVYAPIPKPVKAETPSSFKCPNCGAITRYDVAQGGIACEHCGYLAPVKSSKVGKLAQEFEFTVDTWRQAEQGWGVERQELHCDSCGGNLTLPKASLTVTCPFCGSNRVHLRLAPDSVLRPRFLIPFKIQAAQVNQRAREWLGKGWYHPAELSAAAILDRFTGIYLPFWTFDADVHAYWKAEVGYERQERYYDASDKQWKTRTVIDWRWENGQVSIRIDDLLIHGSSRVSRPILEQLYPFNMNELTAYNPEILAGWQAQAYDITLPDAWEAGKEMMRERSKEACYADIPSSHVRNFNMSADFADETWRYILLPVYLASYRFEDKTYQVMVNGQTGSVAGQKPVAWWKIWLAIAALLAPGLIAGLIGLPLLAAGGIGMILIMAGFILMVIGGVLSAKLYSQARKSEVG